VSPRIEGAGVELAYEEHGAGSPVLLVHGIGEGMAALTGALDPLTARHRVIAYDRRGYGASGAPEPYEGTTVEEQAEDAAALLRGLEAPPVVAVGRDFGALVCLDLLRRHGDLAHAAVVADPWFFAASPEVNEALAAERAELQETVFEHGPAETVRRYGRNPAEHRGFFADFGGSAAWTASRRELRSITAPIAVVVSRDAPAHIRAGAGALVALMPGAELDPVADPLAAIERLAA
jgi:pimeloyl-ACP methyl ester carboxylesterase